MKMLLYLSGWICLLACNGSTGAEMPVSTVDSALTAPMDSVSALYDLDNPYSDSFSIAMDSAVPIIRPEDTAKGQQQ